MAKENKDTPAPAAEQPSERELAIKARVAAGLTRQQAEEVQASQDAWDKEQAKAAKK